MLHKNLQWIIGIHILIPRNIQRNMKPILRSTIWRDVKEIKCLNVRLRTDRRKIAIYYCPINLTEYAGLYFHVDFGMNHNTLESL